MKYLPLILQTLALAATVFYSAGVTSSKVDDLENRIERLEKVLIFDRVGGKANATND